MLAPFKNLNSIYSYSLNNTKYQLSASTATYSYPSTVRRGFCDTFFAYSFNLKKQKKKKEKDSKRTANFVFTSSPLQRASARPLACPFVGRQWRMRK